MASSNLKRNLKHYSGYRRLKKTIRKINRKSKRLDNNFSGKTEIYCRMCDGLYIDVDAKVHCYCSTGVKRIIGQIENGDIMSFFYGPQIEHIRKSFVNRKLPFPECPNCGKKQHSMPQPPTLYPAEISAIHFEPCGTCNLHCPGCPGTELREGNWGTKPERRFFPLSEFKQIVDNISIPLKNIGFVGLGEPLLNPAVPEMIAYLKSNLTPPPYVKIDTNGNVKPDIPALVGSGLDRIHVAIDGYCQESYQQARVGGNIKMVLAFIENLAAERKRQGLTDKLDIVWKYILFNFNDSYEELTAAIAHAKNINVEIRFEDAWKHTSGSKVDKDELQNFFVSHGCFYRQKK